MKARRSTHHVDYSTLRQYQIPNQGIAKRLLETLWPDGPLFTGILSSHPFAISAVLRVFGQGLEDVDLSETKNYASKIMAPARFSM